METKERVTNDNNNKTERQVQKKITLTIWKCGSLIKVSLKFFDKRQREYYFFLFSNKHLKWQLCTSAEKGLGPLLSFFYLCTIFP